PHKQPRVRHEKTLQEFSECLRKSAVAARSDGHQRGENASISAFEEPDEKECSVLSTSSRPRTATTSPELPQRVCTPFRCRGDRHRAPVDVGGIQSQQEYEQHSNQFYSQPGHTKREAAEHKVHRARAIILRETGRAKLRGLRCNR